MVDFDTIVFNNIVEEIKNKIVNGVILHDDKSEFTEHELRTGKLLCYKGVVDEGDYTIFPVVDGKAGDDYDDILMMETDEGYRPQFLMVYNTSKEYVMISRPDVLVEDNATHIDGYDPFLCITKDGKLRNYYIVNFFTGGPGQ